MLSLSGLAGIVRSTFGSASTFSSVEAVMPLFGVRWGTRGGNRGNTYQPNTLKRKRRLGFLARAKSRTGRQVLKRRFEKGRWFLTH